MSPSQELGADTNPEPVCTVCGGVGETLATECPGKELNPAFTGLLRTGKADFANGRWKFQATAGQQDFNPWVGEAVEAAAQSKVAEGGQP
jgi:hypothetical protein